MHSREFMTKEEHRIELYMGIVHVSELRLKFNQFTTNKMLYMKYL